jgi:hypothetical protein
MKLSRRRNFKELNEIKDLLVLNKKRKILLEFLLVPLLSLNIRIKPSLVKFARYYHLIREQNVSVFKEMMYGCISVKETVDIRLIDNALKCLVLHLETVIKVSTYFTSGKLG